MENETLLQQFNTGVHELRETFHKTGRLDDSNSKLDEIVKLLCIEIASVYQPEAHIPTLRSMLDRGSGGIVQEINMALAQAAELEIFRNSDGDSLLGQQPRLNLSDAEDLFAKRLAQLVSDAFDPHLRSPESTGTFEMLNEAFGHFVRDNFRNNIEDAQYMTPPEVVDFMCELGIDEALKACSESKTGPFVMVDPSCGVGSFLAQFYRRWLRSECKASREIVLLGQDKVDRMARLAKLNLLLFGVRDAIITRGNTLLYGSQLDKYAESCDLILTNPPFGARFHTSELGFQSARFFPALHNFIQSNDAYVDSELLFLDRYISLLRPGGTALAVVPDAVVSASGSPELLREYLARKCCVASITELPPVTFGQAGTRTRTCVLHFRKDMDRGRGKVFFGCAKQLGFEVVSRKGVPYKQSRGTNDLPRILDAYRQRDKDSDVDGVTMHCLSPSCVSAPYARLMEEGWTPGHYSASRYSMLATLGERSSDGGVELVRLGDMVTLPDQAARTATIQKHARCISVLHVGDFGSLNIRELMAYAPKYPGQPCSPGDILFSKINPRIPRALVVPHLGIPLACSTEFEVMRAREPYSPHEVMMLLLSSSAQAQIQSLTSGTSSSHNRIKTEQLMSILLPIPGGKSERTAQYRKLVDEFSRAHCLLTQASDQLHRNWKRLDELLSL